MLKNVFNRFVLLQLFKISHEVSGDKIQDMKFYKDIIINGIEEEYHRLFEGMAMNDSTIPGDVSQEVKAIIQMFQHIESSIHIMDDSDQDYLRTHYHVTFQHFQAQNELEQKHFIYFQFYNEHYVKNRIQAIGDKDIGLLEYRRMLATYKLLHSKQTLSKHDIQTICYKKENVNQVTLFDTIELMG